MLSGVYSDFKKVKRAAEEKDAKATKMLQKKNKAIKKLNRKVKQKMLKELKSAVKKAVEKGLKHKMGRSFELTIPFIGLKTRYAW